VGVQSAKDKVSQLHAQALSALHALPDHAPLLKAMADWLVRRQY